MLEKGQEFPPKEDQSRITIQNQWLQMYHSQYIYNKIIDQRGKHVAIDPLIPLPATISEIFSDLLFGEFPNLNFQQESINKQVDNYLSNYNFDTDLLEASTYTSAVGTVFWNLFIVNNKIYYEFITGDKAIWKEDLFGIREILFYKIIKRQNVKDIYTQKYTDYFIQEHYYDGDLNSPNYFDTRKYKLLTYKIQVRNIDNRIEDVYEKQEYQVPNGINFIPVIKILNLGLMDDIIGKSDYQGKEQMFAEVDNRIDQINYVLQENAEPWKALPPGILDNNGWFRRSMGKMFEKGAGGTDNTVDIMTWDASLGSAFQQIETLIRQIFFTSRISSPIAGLDSGGYTESGRALKWRSISTFSVVNRKRKYFGKAIEKFFWMASQIVPELKNLDSKKLVIEWKDGLPLDINEVVDNVIRQVQAGVLSKLSGIKQINEWDINTSQVELEQINKERGDEAEIQSRSVPITL